MFGPDLRELRTAAYDIQTRMQSIPGIVDLQIEPQIEISQLQMRVKREEASRYGLAPGDVAEVLETAFKGKVVSQVIEEDKYFGLVVWYDEDSRRDPRVIEETILETPSGAKWLFRKLPRSSTRRAQMLLIRENVQRRVAVFCNVDGRDLANVVRDINAALQPIEETLRDLQREYFLDYSGQFEAQQQATLQLWRFSGVVSMVGVYLLLLKALGSQRSALQVIANVPLAALGAVVALLIINRPEHEPLKVSPGISGKHLDWSNASIVGTLGRLYHSDRALSVVMWIMMISHYQHMMSVEGMPFGKEMIVRGSWNALLR